MKIIMDFEQFLKISKGKLVEKNDFINQHNLKTREIQNVLDEKGKLHCLS